MSTRQHLVEEWKANLATNAQDDIGRERRFGWFRQVYTRIYRFLISYYGEGEWRGSGEDDALLSTSRMPFVDYRPTTDGLVPKSAERIRATLDSIHDSNPRIATPGTTQGVGDDTWVVVAARKKLQAANAVHRRLAVCGIPARIQNRTTDIAIAVPHRDFSAALQAIEHTMTTPMTTQRIWIRKRIDPTSAVGVMLLLATGLTCLTCVLIDDSLYDQSIVVCGLWFAGLAAGWLCVSGRNRS